MAGDLKAIANMGQLIFNSYWQNSKDRRDSKHAKVAGAGDDEDSSPYGFDSPSAMYINFDPTDDNAFAPSPLRKGNFDLLYNLITQSATIQLLQSEDGVVVSDDDVLLNKASQVFLSQFYNNHLDTHFVGSQWYGKADAFIEELMMGSPIIMNRGEGSASNNDDSDDVDSTATTTPPLVIEPLRVAEQILLRRDKLALEWLKVMEAIPSDHTEIRRLQLNRLTGVTEAAPEKVANDEFQ